MWKYELDMKKIIVENLGYECEGILDIFKSFDMNAFSFCA